MKAEKWTGSLRKVGSKEDFYEMESICIVLFLSFYFVISHPVFSAVI